MGQIIDEYIRKLVQMYYFVRNFVFQLKEAIVTYGFYEYGQFFDYKFVYMGKIEDGEFIIEFIIVEEFIDGSFCKVYK